MIRLMPARSDQPQPVVLAQRLRVHAGQLRGDRDDEDRRVLGDGAAHVGLLARTVGRETHRAPLCCTAAVIRGRGSPSSASSTLTASSAAGVSRLGTATSTVTSRSPDRPLPGTPRPRTRSVWPLAVPAGTLSVTLPSSVGTVSVRVWLVTPLPAQVGQGSSTTWPVPRQLRHGSENANAPWLRLVTPAPWHTGQMCGLVPGLAPLPLQVGHVPGLCMRSGTVTPRAASSKESVASVSTSWPRAGPDAACCRARVEPGAAPPAPPPKRLPKMSPSPPPAPPRPPAAPKRSPRS